MISYLLFFHPLVLVNNSPFLGENSPISTFFKILNKSNFAPRKFKIAN